MREMRHENINSFIGASIDAPNIFVLSVYCARGSLEVCSKQTILHDSLFNCLQDVIKNKDLELDNMFVASLVADLIKVRFGFAWANSAVVIVYLKCHSVSDRPESSPNL